MLDEYFIYDGVNSKDLSIRLQTFPSVSAATPVYESKHVAGRNGSLTFWDGSYNNVNCTIQCYQLTDDAETALTAAQMLSSNPAYKRLELSNEPNVYRMAILKSGFSTEIRCGVLNPATLNFDCKPQRYLKSGEEPVKVTGNGAQLVVTTLDNLYMPCKPTIKITGTAGTNCTLTVNGKTWRFKFQTACTVVFDGNSQDVYSDAVNYNQYVSGDVLLFPEFVTGENAVSIAGFSSAEIIPGWFTV